MKLHLPVEIKFRGRNQRPETLFADFVTGVTPAGSNTFYWEFFRGREPVGDKVTGHHKRILVRQVAESRLFPESRKMAKLLYGWPYVEQIINAKEIQLDPVDNWEDQYSGYPSDTIQIWTIRGFPSSWVIETKSGATLHVINNDEMVVKKPTFVEALKELFKGQTIKITRVQVRTTVETFAA